MTSTKVGNYDTAAAALPDEYFLGQVVSFTITESDILLDTIREEITKRGLRDSTLRKRLRPVDAFKKAAGDIATKFAKTVDAQHSFWVRPVGQTETECHRHVVLEQAIFGTGGKKRRVVHHTVMKLIYDRGEVKDNTRINDSIYVEPTYTAGMHLTAEEQDWLDSAVGDDGIRLRENYEHYCTHMDSHAVRTFVREYLYLLNAINIKGNGGGLYFVQQKDVAELRNLAELIKSIGSQMHLIPLLDIVDQRDMLAQAFVQDTMEEVRQISAEIGRILEDESRTITEPTFDSYAAKAAALIEKAATYQGLLDRNLDDAAFELKVFQKKTLKLVNRVRKPGSLSIGRK